MPLLLPQLATLQQHIDLIGVIWLLLLLLLQQQHTLL
jgi:hypothetical protein